jgi:phosphatidylglycerophosphatase C
MNLALFDFDDTITTSEVFRPFLWAAIRPHRIIAGKFLLLPIVIGHKSGILPGSFVRRSIIKLGFWGTPLKTLELIGEDFAKQFLPGVLRQQAMERINWHRAQGDKIVVVSGSLDVYLSHWCREQDIELICSSLEHRGGVLTGRYSGAQCFGPEKARKIKEKYNLGSYPIIYAYGDSKDDVEMLGLAHRKCYQWEETFS